MREETYSGPRSDTPLTVGMNCYGDEVLVSGQLDIQAFHEAGDRELWLLLYRDDIPIETKLVHASFEHGRLFTKIPFGLIDLPEGGFHVYTLTWKVISSDGGPIYTGMPHFNANLRVRELCLSQNELNN